MIFSVQTASHRVFPKLAAMKQKSGEKITLKVEVVQESMAINLLL
jgi:hypothetical protein